jgi:pimeloyl-ACP methyl ester carboxylesterase
MTNSTEQTRSAGAAGPAGIPVSKIIAAAGDLARGGRYRQAESLLDATTTPDPAAPSATGPGDETTNEATEVSGDIEADGGRLHVEATGKGPAVVLLHGGSADSRMWQGQLAALAGHYRVIRYFLRGLGQSPPPAAPYRMSDDLTAVLDHLGVDSAALCGFSTGGTIALEFAARYPARAAALVLIGAIVPALGRRPPRLGARRAGGVGSQALTTLSARPSQPRSTRPCDHSSTM